LFTWTNHNVAVSNRFVWFKKWVSGRHTLQQLSPLSGCSVRTLKRYFHDYLGKPPVFSVYPSERVNLLIDGTYFSNDLCLVIYRDNTIKFTQLYRLTTGEWYEELKEDLENLLSLNVQIESITCDGHKALLKAIKSTCPDVIVQRCLVHIQRMCRIWLTMRPKTVPGMELRHIVSKLHAIKTTEDRDYWIVSLVQWHQRHEGFLNEKSYHLATGRYWYRHKMVRRSFMVIRKALPHMFHYLENDRIPKTTNGLESFFGHLKGHLAVHRGLSVEHRKNFIKWYLYFKNAPRSEFS
jgi:AraC-like DNA-binding protein